ncbi:MAG: UDP-N-acetylmuramate dehydrogenase [Gemmatimonadota bacterium]
MALTIEEHAPLAPHTTMQVGGPARYLARCRSTGEMRQALEWGRSRGLPVQVLGGGSNTLFADAGYAGLVLKVETRGLTMAAGGDEVMVTAAAGEDWDALVERCIAADLSGVECLSGIPGLVGATPIQNVGAYGQEVAETVAAVKALSRHRLEEVELTNRDCAFGYRQSRFKGADRGRYVVTEVSFRLRRAARPAVRYAELAARLEQRGGVARLEPGRALSGAIRQAVLELRRAKSMVADPQDPNARSAGSFFLNPVLAPAAFAALEERWRRDGDGSPVPVHEDAGGRKVPAAWLVERAGFPRGLRRGGAGVSAHHALALIHCGGGAAAVLSLADQIRAAVAERFGVELEREPEVVEADPPP